MTCETTFHLIQEKANTSIVLRLRARAALLCGLVLLASAQQLWATNKYTPDQKKKFMDQADQYADEATVAAFFGPIGEAIASLALIGANQEEDAAGDPADPNYMVIATPTTIAVEPVAVQAPITPQIAADLTALEQNLAAIAGTLQAANTSMNRAQGASNANQPGWETKQFQAGELYLSEVGRLLEQQLGLRLSVYNDFEAAGLSYTATQAQITAFQQQIAENGFPAGMLQDFSNLGLTSSDISQAQTLVSSLSLSSGAFPGILASPSRLGDLQAAATDFIGIPILVNPANQGVVNTQSSAPIKLVVLGSQALDVTTIKVIHFGPDANPAHNYKIVDYNGDGIPDLVCSITVADSGLQPGDTVVGWYSFIPDGHTLHGSAAITVQ